MRYSAVSVAARRPCNAPPIYPRTGDESPSFIFRSDAQRDEAAPAVGQHGRADRALTMLRGDHVSGAIDADQRPVIGDVKVERGIAQRLTHQEEVALSAGGGGAIRSPPLGGGGCSV